MPISFKEDHISQIPALLMLEKLGYTYLTPDEALGPARRESRQRTARTRAAQTARRHQRRAGQLGAHHRILRAEHHRRNRRPAQHPDGRGVHGGFADGLRPAHLGQDPRTDCRRRPQELRDAVHRLEEPAQQCLPRHRGVCRQPHGG